MNHKELKEALISGAPVRYNSKTMQQEYDGYHVNAIVYRMYKGKVILSAEIKKQGENCVWYVDPKDLTLCHTDESLFRLQINKMSGIYDREPEGYKM